MARHYNPSIAERAQRIFGFKQGDTLPNDISGPVATLDIVPVTKVIGQSAPSTSATSNTVFTTASDKDTYITGWSFGFIKDATCDTGDGTLELRCTIDGAVKTFNVFQILTLTAQAEFTQVQLRYPIKVDRGTNFTMNLGTFTAGKYRRTCTVYGYTEETTAS